MLKLRAALYSSWAVLMALLMSVLALPLLASSNIKTRADGIKIIREAWAWPSKLYGPNLRLLEARSRLVAIKKRNGDYQGLERC